MFHNKKLRIALIVIVLLTGFLALASNTVQVRENPTFLEKGLRIAASPFQSSFHAIHNGIDGIGSYFADKKALEAENKKLREQVDALHHQVARLEETQLENIRLKELLDYKEGMDKAYQLQLAETIAKKNNNLQYMITINKGSEDGVTAGMTVMNHYGLIGRVSSVLSGSAEVLLLPDHESAVGARVKSTREALGVVEGDGTSTGNLQMIHLQHDADIFVGDEVITSGLDGVFPADIPIGEVTAIQYDANGLTKTAFITPYVNFFQLEEVFVMTNSGGGSSQ
ncbi:MAG: rod shape-determining protein MreC [Peptococcaceae bacterium]|nr:rod shape-determining protein MreC [Peptococcaceae bacterium]